MSAESRLNNNNRRTRPLREQEIELLRALLASGPLSNLVAGDLAASRVEELADGGMGSLKFVGAERGQRKYAKTVAEAHYIDADGVQVSITVNVDGKGDLYVLDFWKADFSPLRRYPTPSDLRTVR